MTRVVLSALLALVLASPFALPTSAQGGIGVYAGPFPSTFVDASGAVSDATCAYVVRTQLDDGTYREEAYCFFAANAHLPHHGNVRQDETTSERPFWSDYTYELTGEFELATTWSVTTYWDGTLLAESTYGAEPLEEDSAEFAGFIGAAIPDGDGGAIYLSIEGVKNQAKYGISDEEILEAWDDGVDLEFEDGSVEYEGRWAGGVLAYWIDGHTLLNVRAATWADIQALD